MGINKKNKTMAKNSKGIGKPIVKHDSSEIALIGNQFFPSTIKNGTIYYCCDNGAIRINVEGLNGFATEANAQAMLDKNPFAAL